MQTAENISRSPGQRTTASSKNIPLMSLADPFTSLSDGTGGDNDAFVPHSMPEEISQAQLVATDNDIAALIADISGSCAEPTTPQEPEELEPEAGDVPQVSPMVVSFSILGAASRQSEKNNASVVDKDKQPIVAATETQDPSTTLPIGQEDKTPGVAKQQSTAAVLEPEPPTAPAVSQPLTQQSDDGNKSPGKPNLQTGPDRPASSIITETEAVQNTADEALPDNSHPDRRRALKMEKQAAVRVASDDAMITSPVHHVATEPTLIEAFRPSPIGLPDQQVEAAKPVSPINLAAGQAEGPMPTTLLLEDKDIQDWLLFTNYYNMPYRNQFLKRRRRLAALELERQKLLEEEEEDAALFGRRQMSNASASVALMTPMATPLSTTTAQFATMPRVPTPVSAQFERAPSTEYFPSTRPVPAKRVLEASTDDTLAALERPAKMVKGNDASQLRTAAEVPTGKKNQAPSHGNKAEQQQRQHEKQKENERPNNKPQQATNNRPQNQDAPVRKANLTTAGATADRTQTKKQTASPARPVRDRSSPPPSFAAKAQPKPTPSKVPSKEHARNGSIQQPSHPQSTDRPSSRGRLEDRMRFNRDQDDRDRSLDRDSPFRSDTYRPREGGPVKPPRKALDSGSPDAPDTRFFILKSFNADNIWRSMDDGVWATQPANGPVLTEAFKTCRDVILFFSANKSRAFQGYARMSTAPSAFIVRPAWMNNIHWETTSPFRLEWLNTATSSFHHSYHLINTLNEDRPVSVAKDGQEVEPACARDLIKVLDKSQVIEDSREHRWRR